MTKRILITGGAGFIGSHLADELLHHNYRVRVLDCLVPQVHGREPKRPSDLHPDVDLVVGDIRDRDVLLKSLQDIDAVYHFAAAVGVGQSMYEMAHYTSVNSLGTAILLEALAERPVERLIVASSMSIYGEGAYRERHSGRLSLATERSPEQLQRGDWEMRGEAGTTLEPIPTPETKTPVASSVYALSKFDQERLCLIAGNAYRIPTVALRFFNTYGPRQSPSNPYTGVLAIFASRYLNGKPPLIFEDGYQQRDFVEVHDLVRACRLALEVPEAAGQVFNIGSGQPRTIREVAREMATVLGREDLEPEISFKHRVGDIRHCFADISKAEQILGYRPQVSFREGLLSLAGWLRGQVVTDRSVHARNELATRGLMV